MMRFRPGPALLILTAAACTASEIPTSPGMNIPVTREARTVAGVNYASADLGMLPGDEEAIAWAVNDAGSVVIQSTDFPAAGGRVARYYIQTGVSKTIASGGVYALSGGPATYVVGFNNTGLRWTYSPAAGFSSPTALPARPRAVNDFGDAAIEDGGNAAIVKLDGTIVTIANPNPSLFPFVESRDINNSGDVVVSYQDGYQATPDRGYLRTSDGTMIEFTPLAGHNSTYVRGVSERIDGKIYVAGISDDDNSHYNAIRWAVDVATKSIVATEIGAAGTYSSAMSDDGMIVGVIGSSSAFAWKRGGSLTALKAPKGVGSTRPYGVSGNGRYIAGAGMKGTLNRAVLWSAQ